MKGTLHRTEQGWVVRWPQEDPRDPVPELPVHPDDLDSGIIRWAEIGGLGDKEIEFDWCVIITPEGKGTQYARLTKPKRSIDLQNLETKLHQSLSEETDWTLSRWLKSKREDAAKKLLDEMGEPDDDFQHSYKVGFEEGYNKAKETLYTEEQVREAIKMGTEIKDGESMDSMFYTDDEIIQSLKQNK